MVLPAKSAGIEVPSCQNDLETARLGVFRAPGSPQAQPMSICSCGIRVEPQKTPKNEPPSQCLGRPGGQPNKFAGISRGSEITAGPGKPFVTEGVQLNSGAKKNNDGGSDEKDIVNCCWNGGSGLGECGERSGRRLL